MSEVLPSDSNENLPISEVKPRARISVVWLIPMIAVLIGGWLAYKSWSQIGPTIQITFLTAEGLEAGKTKIKYKNVEIGKVSHIHVNHETNNVEVMAEMAKDIKPFLTDKTRFWVVKARINASGASGLETLLSGAYIGIDPSSEGDKTREFTGLDIPPVITGDISGKYFELHTKNLGSIARDAPVYYHKFNVGRVEGIMLNDDGLSVTIRIFINAPFDRWVHTNTKFWNASGFDFSMNANGIDVDTESLVSILVGGVAFDSNHLSDQSEQAENNAKFHLYETKEDTLKVDYRRGQKYVINFSESLRGLYIGAPVEFRGIQLGEVADIQLSFDIHKTKVSVPVTIWIDYTNVVFKENNEILTEVLATHQERTDFLIKRGLKAQLKTGSLLTGKLFVGLDFFQNRKSFNINWDDSVPEFPSVSGTLGVVKQNITSILKNVDEMVTQVKELSYKLNHKLEPELSSTLKQTNNTLLTIQDTLKNDSAIQQKLQAALREFTKASRAIKVLADYLERHPESLIQGKKSN